MGDALSSFLVAFILSVVGAYGLWTFYRELARPFLIRTRYRRVIGGRSGFAVTRYLGMGREGFVYEVERKGEAESRQKAGLKVLYAHRVRDNTNINQHLRAVASALADIDSTVPVSVVEILEVGEFDVDGESVPYQLMAKVEGRTLHEALGRNPSANLEEAARIKLLDDLLLSLHRMDEAGLHFVHLDLDNVMIDDEGRMCLIDFDELVLGTLDAKLAKRYHRRVARLILALLGASKNRFRSADPSNEAQRYLARLEVNAKSAKGERLPQEAQFDSIEDFRRGLELIAESAKRIDS